MSEENSKPSGKPDTAQSSAGDATFPVSSTTAKTSAETSSAATGGNSDDMQAAGKKKPGVKTSPAPQSAANAKKSAVKQTSADSAQLAGGATKPPASAPREKPSPLRWPGMVSLVLLIPVIAALGYGYWSLRLEQQGQAKLQAQQTALQSRLEELQAQVRENRSALSDEQGARSAVEQQQQALAAQLDNITTRLGRTSFAWRLAEVEYLLTLANHRLEFVQDVDTAIQILESADQRLVQLGDPGLLPVRQAIADELVALRAVAKVDISGIALQLGSMADEVAQLPLVDQQRMVSTAPAPEQTPQKTWRDIPRVVWEHIRSLVQIRRHDQPLEPLLPAKESWYLTQNLHLKLEQARLALVQREPELFRQSLQEADNWLATYYDTDARPVSSLRETITQLLGLDLSKDLPDISASLRLLREFSERQAIGANPSTDNSRGSSVQ